MTSARKKFVIFCMSCSLIGCLLLLILELASYSYHREYSLRRPGNYAIFIGPNGSSSLSLSSSISSSKEPFEQNQQLSITATAETMKKQGDHRSILGKWLRAPEGTPPPSLNEAAILLPRPLLILVWKYGSFLERRHAHRSTANNSDSSSPWQGCSVKDCLLTYRDEDLTIADAVIFHLHMTRDISEIPPKRGKPGQLWIFMTDESPLHTFLYAPMNRDISIYDDTFDWSMTYREDSDVPVAYGRTIARTAIIADNEKQRSERKHKKLVAIMGSNCSSSKNKRWKYVKELKTWLGDKLDIYGRCLNGNKTACPGHFHRDCGILGEYKFYLAFENSNCREYITEKVYWNSYEKKSVPIIMGAPRFDCERLLPPGSFIHLDDFIAPRELADYLRYLDKNDGAYEMYHEWRSRYIVINEHGYFGSLSRHYCRVCEALRYNDRPSKQLSKYRRIGNYWNSSRDCYPYRRA